jgi:spore germination protein YaaH
MALSTGIWNINANGFQSDLTITAVNADGTLQATMFGGQQVVGFWDEPAQKITLIKVESTPIDPSHLQIYTGYLLDASEQTLAGSLEAFAGTGGSAQRSVFGWFAQFQGVSGSRGPHARCGWIEDLDPMANPAGVTTFQNNASFFNVIHPVFYTIDNSTFTLTPTTQDPNHVIPPAAQAAGTDVWPLIAGPTDSGLRDALGQMLNDPARRAQHVTALVNELQAPLLVPGNPVYAGFDINYEGLNNQYHQGFWDFLTELTNQAHVLGKKISVAVGAIDTDGTLRSDYPINPYNYTELLSRVDFIHIECYDFHFNGDTHIGPVAPRGWVADALQVVMNTGSAQQFIYGMPNYGLTVKVVSGDPNPTVDHTAGELNWGFGSLNQLSNACDPLTFRPTTDHMQLCPMPPAPPCCSHLNPGQNFDAGQQPNCQQAIDPSTIFFFDDLASLEERLQLAHDKALGGMTYWTVGDELPGFFDMVKKYF